tara:strand:- start:539 stop:1120 length:582 start_codon:yes stop_codon:yes gene_type:complete
MKDLYLFGGGGHALSCIDVIQKENKFKIKGIFDNKFNKNQRILNYPVINEKNVLSKKFKKNKYGLVCVGQIKTPETRIKIFKELLKNNFLPARIISPFSSVSKDLKIGSGTIVMHGVIINPKVRIGKNCIINTGSIIEHDTVIEDHCHISTGVILNGGVLVKRGSFIGSGSVIIQNKIIRKNSIIPMGSVIKK